MDFIDEWGGPPAVALRHAIGVAGQNGAIVLFHSAMINPISSAGLRQSCTILTARVR